MLLFDNAASSGQVIPLLPGAGGCLVLVTSRRHLGDLPGMVTAVLADVLAPQEAAGMFVQLAPRAEGDRERVAEVVRLAGFLPLAISLLARVFVRHPAWTVADLAAEMRGGVLALAAESDSIAAMFEVSYRGLDPDSRRLFQLLGVHPGTTFDGFAAAALAGIRSSESARLLDGLHKEGLLTEAGYRWYGMHDLIRQYARDLVAGDTVGVKRALGSLLDYYQSAAALAGTRLARQARPGPGAAVRSWLEVPALQDASQALAWARANRASLIACLELATRTGQHARMVALTAGLATLLRSDGPWAEAVTRHAAAADAARQLGDLLGETNALTDLADMRQLTGDHAGAAEIFAKTLDLYRALGDRLGEANALANLGIARRMTDDYAGAAGVLEQALAIYRELGDRLGEANALHNLGRVTHDYPAATGSFEEALRIYRDLGDRLGEANALSNLGAARQMTGDCLGAAGAVEEALHIYRHLGSRFGEANALHNLGTVRQTTGDYLGAAQAVEEALRIYRDLGSRLGEANTLHNLGAVRRMRGDHAGATGVLEEALSVYREIGHRLGEAHSLRELGTVRNLCGDNAGSAAVLDEALSIYRDIDHRQGLTETLNEQGILHLARDEHAEARRCHERALHLARELGSSRDEASALAGLGRAAEAAGSGADAEHLMRQAYQIFQRIGAAEADEIRAELDALAQPGSRDKARPEPA